MDTCISRDPLSGPDMDYNGGVCKFCYCLQVFCCGDVMPQALYTHPRSLGFRAFNNIVINVASNGYSEHQFYCHYCFILYGGSGREDVRGFLGY